MVENTAFFGDVVLRFPKIVHHYFDPNSNWNLLIRWGISFCNQTGVFDQGPHSPILRLVRSPLAGGSPSYQPTSVQAGSTGSQAGGTDRPYVSGQRQRLTDGPLPADGPGAGDQ